MKFKKKWSIFCCVLLLITIIIQFNNNNTANSYSTLKTEKERLFDLIGPDYINYSELVDPLFTLRGMTNDNPANMDYFYMIQEYLEDIGIALDVEILDYYSYVTELIYSKNFDLVIVDLIKKYWDPDWSGIYNENGSLNFFNYHTSMDYNATLGTGINEWYIQEGKNIVPPDESERVQHYWDWEQYIMDELLLTLPLFTPNYYEAAWNNLLGYNLTDGLLQSWGKMSWDGSHTGQDSVSEIVIADDNWTNLNPLFENNDAPSVFIQKACLDQMVWVDAGSYYYPHIISDWTHINATHVRLDIREDIKWQNDSEDIFSDEYLTAEDIYFTLYCWKYLSDYTDEWDWLEDFEIIDDYTLDIFIDADVSTPENEPYHEYLHYLENGVLPEHYLNQTQVFREPTPDITHESWTKFSNHCFGTGLFEIDAYEKSVETNLTIFDDCWWLDSLITNDPALDWANRFGDFRGGLEDLRIRNISNPYTRFSEFEAGKLDLVDVTSYPTERGNFEVNTNFDIISGKRVHYSFMGYNLNQTRGTPMQSMDPCPYKPEMTKGLAIRKAIAYAINRTEINEVVNDGESSVNNYPIYEWLTKWLYPDIIKYDYNLTKAKEYMMYAGYETGLDSDGDGLTDITELEVTFTDRLNPDTDGDTLIDGVEVNVYFTDPLDNNYYEDTDSDGLTNVDEVDIYLTDPLNDDSDEDTMPDGWEVDNSLDPLTDDADDDEDADGLTNAEEFMENTDPNDEDTDGDGLLDGDEVNNYYTDPTVADADLDSDSDGLTNVEEVDTYLTDPFDNDSDDDGIPDGEEVVAGDDGYETDPNSDDTDSDGLTDDYEIDTSLTDPTDEDTDGDGLTDGQEVNTYSTDPLDTDSDDDTILDGEEVVEGEDGYITDPNDTDTDDDTFDDAEEIAEGTDPTDPDDYPVTETTSESTTETGSIGLIMITLNLISLGLIVIIIRKRNKR